MDRNERTYWIGLLSLFIGLTWCASVFVALVVVGAIMTAEGVLTSYVAELFSWLNPRSEK